MYYASEEAERKDLPNLHSLIWSHLNAKLANIAHYICKTSRSLPLSHRFMILHHIHLSLTVMFLLWKHNHDLIILNECD